MAEIGNLAINIGLNSNGFQQGITSMNKQLKLAQAEFKNVSSSAEVYGNATATLKAKQEFLTKSMGIQQQKVDALKAAYEKAKTETGENSKKTQNLAIQYNNAQARLNSLEGQLNSTNNALQDQGDKWDSLKSKISNMGSNLSTVGTKFADVGKKVAKASAILGGAFAAAGAAAIKMGTQLGETSDRLLDLNSITGMSTSEIQKWQHASTIAGTSTEAITMASEKLTQTMDTMSSGTGKAAESAQKLGFSYDQLSTMDADTRMNVLITSLQGVSDKTERAKLGTDLFGKKWAEIAPIVDLGTEGLKEAKANANVFDIETLNNANNFRIAMDDMKEKLSILVMQLGAKLMPVLTSVMEFVQTNMPLIQTVIDTTFSAIGTVVQTGVDILKSFITYIQNLLENSNITLPQIQEIFTAIFENVKTIVSGAIEVIKGIITVIKNIATTVQEWAIENEETLTSIYTTVQEIFEGIQEFVTAVIVALTAFWQEYGDEITEITSTVFATISETIEIVMNIIKDIIKLATDLIKGDWKAVWEDIKKLTNDIWEGIKSVIKNKIDDIKTNIEIFTNNIKEKWSGLWDSVSSIVNNAWDTIKGAFSNLYTNISKWFTGLIEDAMEWGVNLIEGFWEGIKSMASTLAKNIGSFIKTNVTDKIKNVLDIHSPSKVMEGIGGYVVGGLAKGIDDNADTAVKSVTELGEELIGEAATATGNLATAFETGIAGSKNAMQTALGNLTEELLGDSNSFIDNIMSKYGDELVNRLIEEAGGQLSTSSGNSSDLNIFEPVTNIVKETINTVKNIGEVLTKPLKKTVDTLKDTVTNVKNTVTDKVKKVIDIEDEKEKKKWVPLPGDLYIPEISKISSLTRSIQSFNSQQIQPINNVTNQTITVPVVLDGKEIARATASYNNIQQANINKMNGRWVGV